MDELQKIFTQENLDIFKAIVDLVDDENEHREEDDDKANEVSLKISGDTSKFLRKLDKDFSYCYIFVVFYDGCGYPNLGANEYDGNFAEYLEDSTRIDVNGFFGEPDFWIDFKEKTIEESDRYRDRI